MAPFYFRDVEKMATGGHFNEHAAYSKVLLRLIMCGTKVIRRLLKDQVRQYQQTMDTFLGSRRWIILTDLVGKRNETVLFPLNNEPTNIEIWDICLLLYVLLKYCSKLPRHVIENLQKLKEIRNKIAHTAKATLNESMFNDLWKRIGDILEDAIKIINDNDFAKEIEKDVKGIDNGLCFQDVAEYQRAFHQWNSLDSHMVEKLDSFMYGMYS